MNTMTNADLSKLQAALCRAGSALEHMKGADDENLLAILRDAAHASIGEGLDLFEAASIAA